MNAGADAVTRPVIFAVVALLAALAVLSIAFRYSGRRVPEAVALPIATVPLFGGVFLVAICLLALQILPLPVELPLPSMVVWRTIPGQALGTISLDVASTQVSLALLVMFGVVWWCSYQLQISSTQRQILFRAVLVNGVLITIFAVVQKLTWNGKLYWYFPLGPNTTFGPMVYHNISGAWLTFALAAGLYVLLDGRERRAGWLESGTLTDLTLVAVVLVGLLGSLSRGAILSAGIAGLLTLFITPLKSRLRGVGLIAAMAVSVAGLLLWFGIFDSVLNRFAQMSGSYMAEDSRLAHWQSGFQVAKEFWLAGCGAGAYGRVVSAYDWNPQVFDYAHNQYLETLVTMGVPGATLILVALCVLARDVWFAGRFVRGKNRSVRSRDDVALFAAGSFFLISQACHAVVDYCLAIPAIGICFAAMLGMFHARFGLSTSTNSPHASDDSCSAANQPQRNLTTSFPAVLTLVWSIALLVVLAWATLVSFAAARVDLAMRRLPWDRPLKQLGAESLEACSTELETALRWRPHDAVAQEALGNLYVAQYRAAALQQLAAETGVALEDANLWQWTSTEVLHHRANQLVASGKANDLAEMRTQGPVAEHLVPASRAFLRSWQACPLLPEVLLQLEMLGFLQPDLAAEGTVVPDDPVGLARSVAGQNPAILFRCGKLDFAAGRLDAAVDSWRASLSASPRFLPDIVGFASLFAAPDEFINGVIPDDRAVVLQLMTGTRYQQLYEEIILTKAAQVAESLVAAPMQPDDLVFVAELKSRQQQPAAAAELLQQAVLARPEDVAIRFQLAQALAASNRIDDAIRELLLCIRMRPNAEYRRFLESLRSMQQ